MEDLPKEKRRALEKELEEMAESRRRNLRVSKKHAWEVIKKTVLTITTTVTATPTVTPNLTP
jgi:ribosome recycling factor